MADASSGGERIARQAAEWIVRLSADDEAERACAQAGFADWKNADARHAEAAARMEALLGRVRQVRGAGPQAAQVALSAALAGRANRGRSGRSGRGAKLVGTLALACLCALPAWLALNERGPAYWLTDLRSGVGEWPSSTLADGSTIVLGSLSAVDVDFSRQTRTVKLVQGEILVEVAHEAAGGRPFVVETEHGSIRALGTRFTVRREAGWTEVSMLESRVAVMPADRAAGRVADSGAESGTERGDAPLIVAAGERVRLTRAGVTVRERIDPPSVATAWQRRQFVAQELPLPDVLDELGRQRPGRILYDREKLAGIKVSAVLPLGDPDRALQLLVNNFPELRVRTVTPYLVTVDRRTREADGAR
ncbi:MAG: hypothetical protein BGO63_14030 [Candidatus Accumulibacter sp. 66-26]|nr:FecR domain-containing protein [Accumulibacter sp.]OJW46789.1 MAG: hypothetical protein BGO63_14030 [Candidatus Accumulibacter sp. 66-26]